MALLAERLHDDGDAYDDDDDDDDDDHDRCHVTFLLIEDDVWHAQTSIEVSLVAMQLGMCAWWIVVASHACSSPFFGL